MKSPNRRYSEAKARKALIKSALQNRLDEAEAKRQAVLESEEERAEAEGERENHRRRA